MDIIFSASISELLLERYEGQAMSKEAKTSEIIENFLNGIRGVVTTYPFEKEAVEVEDKRTQDLLHELELGPSDGKDKVATKLRKSRKERRIHKDYIEINESIYNYWTSPTGTAMMKQLTDILGTIRKQEKSKQNRIYIPRVEKKL